MGGQIGQYEYNRSIWIIKGDSEMNQYIPQNTKGSSKNLRYAVKAEKLKIDGPEPNPRTLQTAVFYKKYIIVFGGRNDKDINLGTYCLNDIMIFDIDPCDSWRTGRSQEPSLCSSNPHIAFSRCTEVVLNRDVQTAE